MIEDPVAQPITRAPWACRVLKGVGFVAVVLTLFAIMYEVTATRRFDADEFNNVRMAKEWYDLIAVGGGERFIVGDILQYRLSLLFSDQSGAQRIPSVVAAGVMLLLLPYLGAKLFNDGMRQDGWIFGPLLMFAIATHGFFHWFADWGVPRYIELALLGGILLYYFLWVGGTAQPRYRYGWFLALSILCHLIWPLFLLPAMLTGIGLLAIDRVHRAGWQRQVLLRTGVSTVIMGAIATVPAMIIWKFDGIAQFDNPRPSIQHMYFGYTDGTLWEYIQTQGHRLLADMGNFVFLSDVLTMGAYVSVGLLVVAGVSAAVRRSFAGLFTFAYTLILIVGDVLMGVLDIFALQDLRHALYLFAPLVCLYAYAVTSVLVGLMRLGEMIRLPALGRGAFTAGTVAVAVMVVTWVGAHTSDEVAQRSRDRIAYSQARTAIAELFPRVDHALISNLSWMYMEVAFPGSDLSTCTDIGLFGREDERPTAAFERLLAKESVNRLLLLTVRPWEKRFHPHFVEALDDWRVERVAEAPGLHVYLATKDDADAPDTVLASVRAQQRAAGLSNERDSAGGWTSQGAVAHRATRILTRGRGEGFQVMEVYEAKAEANLHWVAERAVLPGQHVTARLKMSSTPTGDVRLGVVRHGPGPGESTFRLVEAEADAQPATVRHAFERAHAAIRVTVRHPGSAPARIAVSRPVLEIESMRSEMEAGTE